MLAHQAFPTIIGGDSQGELIVEELEKIAQVTNPSLNVLLGVERIVHPVVLGNERHQLHETLGAFGGDGRGIEIGFDGHEGTHQVGAEPVTTGQLFHFGAVRMGLHTHHTIRPLGFRRAAVVRRADLG